MHEHPGKSANNSRATGRFSRQAQTGRFGESELRRSQNTYSLLRAGSAVRAELKRHSDRFNEGRCIKGCEPLHRAGCGDWMSHHHPAVMSQSYLLRTGSETRAQTSSPNATPWASAHVTEEGNDHSETASIASSPNDATATKHEIEMMDPISCMLNSCCLILPV